MNLNTKYIDVFKYFCKYFFLQNIEWVHCFSPKAQILITAF